jgi:hypothetical protein
VTSLRAFLSPLSINLIFDIFSSWDESSSSLIIIQTWLKSIKILLLLPPRPPLCVHFPPLSHIDIYSLFISWRYQSASVWFSSHKRLIFYWTSPSPHIYLSFIDNKTRKSEWVREWKKVVLNLIFSKLYFGFFLLFSRFFFSLCDKSRVRWMQNGCWWSIRIMIFTRIQSCVGMKWFFFFFFHETVVGKKCVHDRQQLSKWVYVKFEIF